VYQRQAIEDLVPGMILGKMVVTTDGKVFLNEGAVLTSSIIQALQRWGFRYVNIRLEVAEEPSPGKLADLEDQDLADSFVLTDSLALEVVDLPSGAVQDAAIEEPVAGELEIPSNVPEFFVLYYQAAVQIMKKYLSKVRFIKDDFDVTDIKQMVGECIMPLIENHSAIENLQMIPRNEDYLYHHSVDVGVISGCLGLWMGQSCHEIEETILGALLHDVGKALIPLKVLNKPGVLTEEELKLVRYHSLRGYRFLKQYSNLSRNPLLCVLQHHERIDGSGYPLSVQGDKIHPYAKIIAVADVFDAMTSVRSYARRFTPYEAVEIMRREMIGKLDNEVCTVFLDQLSHRFVGDLVQLGNG
jgi:HD-GYP domain-containing protein (c-di-GMP phosphodiesterase class II)